MWKERRKSRFGGKSLDGSRVLRIFWSVDGNLVRILYWVEGVYFYFFVCLVFVR